MARRAPEWKNVPYVDPLPGTSLAKFGFDSKTKALDELKGIDAIFNDAYKRHSKKPTTVEDAVAMITGIDNRIVAEPAKKYTKKQKAERAAENVAFKAKILQKQELDQPIVSDQADGGSAPEEIMEESEKELQDENEEYLLSQFPKGTTLNADQTLTLPDGRMIRKITEVEDEQTA